MFSVRCDHTPEGVFTNSTVTMITRKSASLRYIDLYEISISYDKEKFQSKSRSSSSENLPVCDVSISMRYRFNMTRRNFNLTVVHDHL